MTPSLRFIALLGLAGAGPLGVVLFGIPYIVGFSLIAVVLAIAILDRYFGTDTVLEFGRNVGKVLSVGTDNKIEIKIRNRHSRSVTLEVIDEAPVEGDCSPKEPQTMRVPGREQIIIEYSYTPLKRGRFQFGGIQARYPSMLGLWLVKQRYQVENEIHVYPNIEALHRFELLAQRNNLSELGFYATRMKGDGHEFERMREYREGDDPRRVDWKTTARVNKLIVREMGQDRNQNVVFLIDMGRMMQQTTGGLSHFDTALNTAIILGHIAQKKGDNIGAILFSDRVKKYIPLSRGRSAVDALVNAVYDVEPESTATNYKRAFKYVMANVNKRSLLLLMTHFIPGEDQRLIRAYTQQLGRQHLPLCLFFKEPSLESALADVPGTVNDAFHKAAAADLMIDRVEALSTLQHAGVMALDALPGEYSAHAISNYLDIKARNLL